MHSDKIGNSESKINFKNKINFIFLRKNPSTKRHDALKATCPSFLSVFAYLKR